MRTTIDAAGRVVIPKDIRAQAGLQPGMPLDVRWRDGVIELEPAPVPVRLVRKGRFVVAMPQAEGPALTTATVEDTRDTLAREHEHGQ
jgi:AbrB family looped-hinge helix DNA binding protein